MVPTPHNRIKRRAFEKLKRLPVASTLRHGDIRCTKHPIATLKEFATFLAQGSARAAPRVLLSSDPFRAIHAVCNVGFIWSHSKTRKNANYYRIKGEGERYYMYDTSNCSTETGTEDFRFQQRLFGRVCPIKYSLHRYRVGYLSRQKNRASVCTEPKIS